MARTWGKVDWLASYLESLRHTVDARQYLDVIDVLEPAIHRAGQRIEEATVPPTSDEFVDAVTDEACALTEDILGTAFVVFQRRITEVTESALSVRKYAIDKGRSFSPFTNKQEVRAIGRRYRRTQYSRIEVIWAFANYFKHRDEWGSWSGLAGVAKKTAQVIRAAGAEEGSSGNQRRGAEVLGATNYHDLRPISAEIERWGMMVYTRTARALRRKP